MLGFFSLIWMTNTRSGVVFLSHAFLKEELVSIFWRVQKVFWLFSDTFFNISAFFPSEEIIILVLVLPVIWKSQNFKVVAQFHFVSCYVLYWMCLAHRILPLFLCQVLFLSCRANFKWIFKEIYRHMLNCRLFVSFKVFFFSLSSLRKPVQSDELKHILKIIYCKCYFSAIFMPLWLKIISFKFLVISCLKFRENWDDVSVNSVCRVMMYLQRLYLPLWTLSSWSLHPSVCRKQDIYYQHLFHYIQSCQLLAVEAYSSLLVLEK